MNRSIDMNTMWTSTEGTESLPTGMDARFLLKTHLDFLCSSYFLKTSTQDEEYFFQAQKYD